MERVFISIERIFGYMDRFSEQLLTRQSTGKDMFIRGLIIAGALVIFAGLVIGFMYFGTAVVMPCVALAAGDIFLAKWLLEGTFVEYEYIVTNDDLDIDKIVGKRKRVRLITVSLKTCTEIAEYTDNTDIGADVTVMAHDNTGVGMWYLLSDNEKYGKLAVIFNPDENTAENIVGGFAPAVKTKYSSLIKNREETEEEEN